MHAQCQCGQLAAEVAGTTDQIVACHCHHCQRRSGSPFGLMAYYLADAVKISGDAREFTRPADSGNMFTTGFCPQCGATVWARADQKPGIIGIPVGAFANASFPAPARSVWEQSKHAWVVMPDDIPQFPRGRT